mmetsp:Transcript_35396/g.101700  ORF Transcript_35396/g.101700 Transcript_35396/m.101700 type:complete len:270 (+) Transcript_35396:513-1322(+)
MQHEFVKVLTPLRPGRQGVGAVHEFQGSTRRSFRCHKGCELPIHLVDVLLEAEPRAVIRSGQQRMQQHACPWVRRPQPCHHSMDAAERVGAAALGDVVGADHHKVELWRLHRRQSAVQRVQGLRRLVAGASEDHGLRMASADEILERPTALLKARVVGEAQPSGEPLQNRVSHEHDVTEPATVVLCHLRLLSHAIGQHLCTCSCIGADAAILAWNSAGHRWVPHVQPARILDLAQIRNRNIADSWLFRMAGHMYVVRAWLAALANNVTA